MYDQAGNDSRSAPARTASFAFRFASGSAGAIRYLTAPVIAQIPVPVMCICVVDEVESLCRRPPGTDLRATTVGEGHHFGGEYAKLVKLILR